MGSVVSGLSTTSPNAKQVRYCLGCKKLARPGRYYCRMCLHRLRLTGTIDRPRHYLIWRLIDGCVSDEVYPDD
jgi:hypothetical protein